MMSKILCAVFGHNEVTEIRKRSPAFGREQVRCKRCGKETLVEEFSEPIKKWEHKKYMEGGSS